MAYLKELRTHCEASGCMKGASVELFNNRNSSMGKFCKACGHRKHIALQKAEEGIPKYGSRADSAVTSR